MKKTFMTMSIAAVVALSSVSCSDNAASEKNLFADVAGKMQKRMEYALKSMDGSLSESERAKYAEKEQTEFNEALDIAEDLGGCEIPGATDDEFGLTLKGPFKVFMFNRDDGCFYLVAPAELDQDTRNFYAIGYADETPVYYIDGAEGIDDEGHLQMVMITGEEEGAEDTEYLQVKLMIRPTDAEQLAKVNKIVLTQNEDIFNRLKTESEQRVAKSIKEAHGGRVDEPVAGELGLFELRGPVKKCVWGRYTLEFDNKGMWVAENGKKPWAEKPNVSRDSQGRITKMAIDYDEEYTQFEYDKNGHIVKRHVHYMDGDDITYYKYDEAGDCLLCQNSYSGMDAEEGDDNRITHYTINKRDEKGNWTERTTSDGTKETRTILYY